MDDPRIDPPLEADERATPTAFLDFNRETRRQLDRLGVGPQPSVRPAWTPSLTPPVSRHAVYVALHITRCEIPSEYDSSGPLIRDKGNVPRSRDQARSILTDMQPGSQRDRIIEAIRGSSRPLDDDQLAERTAISPRQRVNQICRELGQAGMVRRRPGPDGKIVNEWLGNHDPQPAGTPPTFDGGVSRMLAPAEAVAIQAVHDLPPGSSREQRDAERVMLDELGRQLGRELNPVKLTVPSGERVEVDGAMPTGPSWSNAGPTRDRPSQPSATRCCLMPSS
jgi:hypothetical protein